ncbi:MAG TPA: lysophospholipid acyltransferase family protein [Polyangia bacterium]|nr:lysophospholipid acyltransferase family protein [Polyangia bacterium]
MLRRLVTFVVFVVLTLVLSLSAIVAGLFDRTGDVVVTIARLWARVIFAVAGIRMRVKLHAPLDPKRPYVFMSNHASTVDIWAVFVGVPVPLRFIAKKQLGQIPIFGWAMMAGRFIFIDRKNPAAARRSIDQAAARIAKGCSVVIYPEGTRSRDGRLAPFKKGGFHLAVSAGADIVPVAIRGSREIMPPGALFTRAGEIELELGAPIPTAGLTPADREALTTKVRGQVAAMLGVEAEAPAPSVQHAK